jgi:hypothetical protein
MARGCATIPRGRCSARSAAAPARTALPQANAYAMIRRRAAAAGIETKLGNHSFRATGITAYLKNGGTRYQPVRTICAKPKASFRSDLFSCSDKAALAWRASRQTTGKPSLVSSCQCQLDRGPLSNPMRTACGALARTAAAITSGLELHLPCHTVFPLLSTTHSDVCSSDTSSPTYCSTAILLSFHHQSD